MNTLKNAIVETLKKIGDGVSYADLSKLEGFTGQIWHGSSEFNQFFWFACSDEAIGALKYLINNEIITIHPLDSQSTLLVSLSDGIKPKYPIATQKKKYKSPHWVPVVFYKGPKFHAWNPAQ